MPGPIPPAPVARNDVSTAYQDRQDFELWGKSDVIAAVLGILEDIRNGGQNRNDLLERVARWGNPYLDRMLAHLVALADKEASEVPDTGMVLDLIDLSLGDDGDLWTRYRLEQDLKAICVPGNALSKPFRPGSWFYDFYEVPVPAGIVHSHNVDGYTGGSRH